MKKNGQQKINNGLKNLVGAPFRVRNIYLSSRQGRDGYRDDVVDAPFIPQFAGLRLQINFE